ncbi:MAG: aminotransferase class III-fold pyridoxal phosphate-dependent enzyme, partial [Clostridium sp.]
MNVKMEEGQSICNKKLEQSTEVKGKNIELKKLVEMDLKHIWHPCSQMKDYEELPPIVIERGKGINLYDINGKEYADVVSSWWCNLLGHCNERINAAVKN